MAKNLDADDVITDLEDLYFDPDEFDDDDFVEYEFHGTGDTGGE